MAKSDSRRNSPGSGERTWPWLIPLPGARVPGRSVCPNSVRRVPYTSHPGSRAHLEEELRIKRAERRVERRARNSRVHVVLSGRAVRSEERDDLVGKEAGVEHAQENLVDGVERLRNGQVGCRLGDVRATCEELETRTTAAVRDANSAGELDAIETDWGQVMG